jgi:hypothetical protein
LVRVAVDDHEPFQVRGVAWLATTAISTTERKPTQDWRRAILKDLRLFPARSPILGTVRSQAPGARGAAAKLKASPRFGRAGRRISNVLPTRTVEIVRITVSYGRLRRSNAIVFADQTAGAALRKKSLARSFTRADPQE